MTQELENSKIQRVAERESGFDYFEMMKLRFLSFKKHKYMYVEKCSLFEGC